MASKPMRWMVGSGLALAAIALVLPWASGGRVPVGVAAVLLLSASMIAVLGLLYRRAEACDVAPAALGRRYTRELMLGMGTYVVVVLLSVWLLRRVDDVALRAVIALLPVPPVAYAVRAMVRYIRGADELQRRIELEALSIATAFVSLLYMAGGFLQSARVIDLSASAAMIWVLPLVCFCYGVCKAFVARRYQ
ncbi:hypothetical protein E2F46_11860 [Luteimonas aestuarii]|uniref:Uncharacterized protein n=1 Tax=Luteimonas aestuarii TaxID=453837 RepID=A0A4R5TT79_9GAMM|nr:hypothetical protein [Luteimonas aestuarii]TDK23062.1 hypothetical protein E2F46_11860 [Luteimonas aestuarii]